MTMVYQISVSILWIKLIFYRLKKIDIFSPQNRNAGHAGLNRNDDDYSGLRSSNLQVGPTFF